MAKKKSSNGLLSAGVIILAFLIIGGLIAIIFALQYYVDTNPKKEPQNPDVNAVAGDENEVVINFDYPEFQSSKVIKSPEDVDSKISYEIRKSDPCGMFTAVIREDKVYIQKKDITGLFDSTYVDSKIEANKLYEIGNINKKVIDVHIGYCGEGIKNPMMLILTEDGSLRYVKLLDAITTGNYAASDVALKKAVRIEDVAVTKDNVETNSIVIITEDGNIYDLLNII